ncbi:hypothetical protein [Paraburkholderia sp. RAU2J]|uniref:hypothetical protein n=1 Tax=Paraburkholderia sp. RAU2J TaxID=1938810 RepID=UPI000EAEBEAC|nr:hypothetical protein [Paraburkholderia sp. RAU2J]
MFDTLKRLIKKWRASRDGGHQLDALLAIADRTAPYPERSEWLIELAHWIRRGRAVQTDALEPDASRSAPAHTRSAAQRGALAARRDLAEAAPASTGTGVAAESRAQGELGRASDGSCPSRTSCAGPPAGASGPPRNRAGRATPTAYNSALSNAFRQPQCPSISSSLAHAALKPRLRPNSPKLPRNT